MVIKRERYLKQIIEKKRDGMIKIVTGIRRCGKSYLMNVLFRQHLLEEGVDKDSLIGGKSDIVMVPRWIRDIVASAKQCAAFTVEYEDVHYAMNKAELQSHLEKCRPDVLADIQGRL